MRVRVCVVLEWIYFIISSKTKDFHSIWIQLASGFKEMLLKCFALSIFKLDNIYVARCLSLWKSIRYTSLREAHGPFSFCTNELHLFTFFMESTKHVPWAPTTYPALSSPWRQKPLCCIFNNIVFVVFSVADNLLFQGQILSVIMTERLQSAPRLFFFFYLEMLTIKAVNCGKLETNKLISMVTDLLT